jgi:3-isopropylmalate/(R)-2-methylmalate dehydratase small subunit
MRPISGHTGRCIPLRRAEVDTDQIIPAEYCRRLERTGYADALFARWRQQPEFVFNEPERRTASVLIAGAHFGTGSSREHAVWALRDWGIRAVVAPSFGDIFRRNALRNGVLVAALPDEVVTGLLDEAERDAGLRVTVNLAGREVRWGAGPPRPFEVDVRARWLLVNGLDEIEVTLGREAEVTRYEQGRARWMPRSAPETIERGR